MILRILLAPGFSRDRMRSILTWPSSLSNHVADKKVMNIFVFDIETVPDVDSGRRLHDFVDLSDNEVAQAMFKLRRQETGGSEFLRLHLQRIVAISMVLRSGDQIKVWSLGDSQASEREIIERFYAGLEKYCPTLVSWNGGGFDLPVLHYRALLHGIPAPSYWETGESEQSFRWNNYLILNDYCDFSQIGVQISDYFFN